MKKPPIRILIVDDDEDDFFIISKYIKKIEGREFIIDWCNQYNDARRLICEGNYELYFIDYLLNAHTGLELIQESIKNGCEEPFVLLTGNGSRAIDMQAMESGAVDYLVKGELGTEKLERCIRYAMERSAYIKALKSSESKFRSIFERSKDTVFTATELLFFTEVNDASYNLLGYKREELIAKNLFELLANKDDIAVIKELLATKEEVSDKELVLLTKNREQKSCMLSLSIEKNIKGEPYIQGIIYDITLLKKAERTTLMLEKINVTSRLVRMMAHEVRNPLNNIMLSAEQLELTDTNEESKMCLDIINRNSKRIEHIIAELLNSSRPSQVSVQKKSLQAIIDESLESAVDRITLRRIHLKRDYIESPAWIMADNEKLKIAFLNIIINAVEAMPEEEGELLVAVEHQHAQYVVSIQDNGCGISEENLSHLFEPYFTSKQNGMGLGLSSALNILKSHNASFDVQSKLNTGTVFKLFFDKAPETVSM
jgi:PAS domain S-box-containing protein